MLFSRISKTSFPVLPSCAAADKSNSSDSQSLFATVFPSEEVFNSSYSCFSELFAMMCLSLWGCGSFFICTVWYSVNSINLECMRGLRNFLILVTAWFSPLHFQFSCLRISLGQEVDLWCDPLKFFSLPLLIPSSLPFIKRLLQFHLQNFFLLSRILFVF